MIGQKVEGFAYFHHLQAILEKHKSRKNVFINLDCRFQDQGGITIGNDVLIGHNTVIATLNHDQDPKKRENLWPSPVVIENKVWIGSNATILPGVTIGYGAIIAA